jgi:AcrR family transcriptional regulator
MASPIVEPKPHSEQALRLLDAAMQEFADNGFDAASVREICKRAGMNVAAVNYYFGDKERLYIEAVKRAHVCSTEGPFPEFPPDAGPVDQLRGFIAVMVARMHAPASPSAMKLVMREMADPGKAAHVVVQEFIQPIAFRLRAIVESLFPDADPAAVLMIGFSVMGQILFYRQNRPVAELIFGKEPVDALTLERVTDHVTRFTLAALGCGEPVGGRR